MDREKLVEQAFQRGTMLNLNNSHYQGWLEEFFKQEYREDVGAGDITSKAVLVTDKLGRAVVKAKQSGVVAGVEEVSWFFKQHDFQVEARVQDADKVQKGNVILKVAGRQRDILAAERIGLNVMQRMSGIATETKRLVELLKGYNTKVAATRKTHCRYLDKKAVFLGGGLTHRLGLWDSILIKDNHLQALKNNGIKNYIEEALNRASKLVDKVGFIEIEATSEDEALVAARKFKQLRLAKPCVVMLDNMTAKNIRQVVEKLRSENLYDYVLLEASGNIAPENIREYAKTEIDVVSLGYLTHSAKAFDMSMEMAT